MKIREQTGEAALDQLPKRASVREAGHKDWPDPYHPTAAHRWILRALRKNVNRPWSRVFHELLETLRADEKRLGVPRGQEVDFVLRYIRRDLTAMADGSLWRTTGNGPPVPYGELFCPRDVFYVGWRGLLCVAKARK